MTTTITIGKKLIPLEQIALVEPFDPEAASNIQTDRLFKTRIVLLDRDSVLMEEELPEFAERHGFRMLNEDGIATNPAIHFNVEGFTPSAGFEPRKPYRSRLVWRDLDGERQSRLLLTEPGEALAISVRGEQPLSTSAEPALKPIKRRRRRPLSPAPQ